MSNPIHLRRARRAGLALAVATAFEEAYGWQLIREDGTWYQLGDAVRSGNVQLYRVQPDKGFAFATGSESSQTRYRWS